MITVCHLHWCCSITQVESIMERNRYKYPAYFPQRLSTPSGTFLCGDRFSPIFWSHFKSVYFPDKTTLYNILYILMSENIDAAGWRKQTNKKATITVFYHTIIPGIHRLMITIWSWWRSPFISCCPTICLPKIYSVIKECLFLFCIALNYQYSL